MLAPQDFFDLERYRHRALFDGVEHVWEALVRRDDYVRSTLEPNAPAPGPDGPMLARTLVLHGGEILSGGFTVHVGARSVEVRRGDDVLSGASVLFQGAFLLDGLIEIGAGVTIYPGAVVMGPTILGEGTSIRPGAYVRGQVVTGRDCIIGHASEAKGAILLDKARAPHKAYVGDSILGNDTNLGSGTSLANLKERAGEALITLRIDGRSYPTGLRKLGSVLGDGAETGCNTVCNPGTLVGRGTLLYPSLSARGYYPPGSIVKNRPNVTIVSKRP